MPNQNPVIDGFAQIGFLQHFAAHTTLADEVDFGRSRRQQSGSAGNKFRRRRQSRRPGVSDAINLHARRAQSRLQKTRQADELKNKTIRR